MGIKTVDVSDWLDWERTGVDLATPYEVISSPYGETVSQRFATEGEAMAEHDAIAGMTGTYNTSWGEEDVNTEATILHYVDTTPAPEGSAESIGIRKPYDMSDDLLIGYADTDSGMVYEIYDTTDCVGVIIARHHEDVGLVTYYRAYRSAQAYAMVPDTAEVFFRKRGWSGL